MLTKAEILKEYGNCIMSPIYAIETYLVTFDKTQEGFVPFKLFPRQKEIIHAYEAHRFNIVTKPRQAGVSTTTAAYMSIKVGFADRKNPEAILIIANKQDLAFEFLGKIKEFLNQLPRWIWGPEFYGTAEKEKKSIFLVDSKKEIMLPNKSRVKAVATSKDALRGFTPTYLIMDEAAYIDNGAEVFGAALTALGTGGKATLISTPNGYDSLYYKTYEQSKAGKNNFNIIEMKWYEDLRYNKGLKWNKKGLDGAPDEEHTETEFTFESYEKKIKDGWKPTSFWYQQMAQGMNNDAKMIAQELDVSFIGSGGNVINQEDVKDQERLNVMDPQWTDGEEDEIWIWEEPVVGHQYIMGVDVARGDGEDASTIVIVDFTTMTQVLEYQGKVQPDLLAYIVQKWGDIYAAYTVVDVTGGMGVTTVLKLLEIGYKRLHYDTPNGKVFVSKQKEMDQYKMDDKLPGFTIGSVRTPLVSNLEMQIRLNMIKVRSRRLISEMNTFVYKNGRADHMDGYHDDLLFALGMALWVLEHSFKKLEKLEVQTKAMLKGWVSGNSAITTKLDDKGNNKKEPTKAFKSNGWAGGPNGGGNKPIHRVNARNVQDPTGKYAWLLMGKNK